MAFKMKGPGLPGFRKTQKQAFYKSKPFSGDGRPSSSPFQSSSPLHGDDQTEHPHSGNSMHALETQRQAELAKDDYSVKRDVELDEDATTKEKLIAGQSTDLVQEKTRFSAGQIYHAHNTDVRNHKKAFKRSTIASTVDGDSVPGVRDGVIVNQRKFSKYFDNAWQEEQVNNTIGFAYRDLSGTKTVTTHLDPRMTEQRYQLTNQEAVDYHLGDKIGAMVETIFTKDRDQWTKEEKLTIDRLMQEKNEETRKLIKTNLKERLNQDFIDQHSTRGTGPTEEQAAAEGWNNVGKDPSGNIIWKNNRGERFVPENAWSSSEWLGKVAASELGLGVEDEDYWNVGILTKRGKTVEENIPEGVVASQLVSGGVDPETGKTLQSSRGNVGTTGITHVYKTGKDRVALYNYRDEEGVMHKKINQAELDELKSKQPSVIEELKRKEEELAASANAKEQALKQERINLATEHHSTIPDEDEFREKYGIQFDTPRDSRKFKKFRKDYDKALDKWTKAGDKLGGSSDPDSDFWKTVTELEYGE